MFSVRSFVFAVVDIVSESVPEVEADPQEAYHERTYDSLASEYLHRTGYDGTLLEYWFCLCTRHTHRLTRSEAACAQRECRIAPKGHPFGRRPQTSRQLMSIDVNRNVNRCQSASQLGELTRGEGSRNLLRFMESAQETIRPAWKPGTKERMPGIVVKEARFWLRDLFISM